MKRYAVDAHPTHRYTGEDDYGIYLRCTRASDDAAETYYLEYGDEDADWVACPSCGAQLRAVRLIEERETDRAAFHESLVEGAVTGDAVEERETEGSPGNITRT